MIVDFIYFPTHHFDIDHLPLKAGRITVPHRQLDPRKGSIDLFILIQRTEKAVPWVTDGNESLFGKNLVTIKSTRHNHPENRAFFGRRALPSARRGGYYARMATLRH
jgi:hypothetical protein